MENLIFAFICERCALPGFVPIPAGTPYGTLSETCRHCGHRQQVPFRPNESAPRPA